MVSINNASNLSANREVMVTVKVKTVDPPEDVKTETECY